MFHNPNDVHSLSSIELNDRIQHCFENPHLLLGAGDLHLLDNDLQATLNLSMSRKRQWLEVIDHCTTIKRNHHHDLLTQHRPIAS